MLNVYLKIRVTNIKEIFWYGNNTVDIIKNYIIVNNINIFLFIYILK